MDNTDLLEIGKATAEKNTSFAGPGISVFYHPGSIVMNNAASMVEQLDPVVTSGRVCPRWVGAVDNDRDGSNAIDVIFNWYRDEKVLGLSGRCLCT